MQRRNPAEERYRATRTVFWCAAASACALFFACREYPCDLLAYAMEFAGVLSAVAEAALIYNTVARR